jgi:hypothetical protein
LPSAHVERAARETGGPPATIMERAMRFIEETTRGPRNTERSARFSSAQVEALQLVLDAETARSAIGWAAGCRPWRR